MTQLTLTGALLKQRGLELAESNNDLFIDTMRTIAKGISLLRGEVTTDDLREAAATARLRPATPNAWGTVFRGKGWIEIGRRPSLYPSNHAREIRVWRWEPS